MRTHVKSQYTQLNRPWFSWHIYVWNPKYESELYLTWLMYPIMPESFYQPPSILVNKKNSRTQRTSAKPLLLLYNLALPIIFAPRGTPRTWRARNYKIAIYHNSKSYCRDKLLSTDCCTAAYQSMPSIMEYCRINRSIAVSVILSVYPLFWSITYIRVHVLQSFTLSTYLICLDAMVILQQSSWRFHGDSTALRSHHGGTMEAPWRYRGVAMNPRGVALATP